MHFARSHRTRDRRPKEPRRRTLTKLHQFQALTPPPLGKGVLRPAADGLGWGRRPRGDLRAVLLVIRFSTEKEALEIANGVTYGLLASVWTRDLNRGIRLTRSIQAGTDWINTFMDGHPRLPFGGYKQSGLGRELGPHALADYQEYKTVLFHTAVRNYSCANSRFALGSTRVSNLRVGK